MSKARTEPFSNLIKASFGFLRDGGCSADIYTLRNENGIVAKVTNFGATLTELWVPDRFGKTVDVVLGFDSLPPYEENKPYFGGTIGRYANRIAGATFTLNDKEYKLAANDGLASLHGGSRGFSKRIWQAEPLPEGSDASVRFTYLSSDMEEGYPGNLLVAITYTLTADNQLELTYKAVTDQATPINLTHHSYFNLAGAGRGDVLKHQLQINADFFTPVDADLIPTGKFEPVQGTPLDFTGKKAIGRDILPLPGECYDCNYVLRSMKGGLTLAAVVTEPESGRTMHMSTSEPGLQLFVPGDFFDGSISGIGGAYQKHGALCLEAQHFPDSVHHENFPGVILHPGKIYRQKTIYAFSNTCSSC